MHYNFKGAKKTPSNATKEVNTEEEKKKKENSSKNLVYRFTIFCIKSPWRPLIMRKESYVFKSMYSKYIQFHILQDYSHTFIKEQIA